MHELSASVGTFSEKSFQPGIGPIHMDYVACNGTESGLQECRYFSHTYGCSHSDDVGVQCQPGVFLILRKI